MRREVAGWLGGGERDAVEGGSIVVRAKLRKVGPRRQARSCGRRVRGGRSVVRDTRRVKQRLVSWLVSCLLFLLLLLLLLHCNVCVTGFFPAK